MGGGGPGGGGFARGVVATSLYLPTQGAGAGSEDGGRTNAPPSGMVAVPTHRHRGWQFWLWVADRPFVPTARTAIPQWHPHRAQLKPPSPLDLTAHGANRHPFYIVLYLACKALHG